MAHFQRSATKSPFPGTLLTGLLLCGWPLLMVPAQETATNAAQGSAIVEAASGEVKQTALQALRSVVAIDARDESGESWSGSGVLIDAAQGLVLTNLHLVRNNSRVAATWTCRFAVIKDEGDQQAAEGIRETTEGISASVIFRDATRQLALLKLDSVPESVRALAFAETSVNEGERVLALGAGSEKAGRIFQSQEGAPRAVYERKLGSNEPVQVIEVQLPLSKGFSGGPLTNLKGELVGLVQGLITESRVQLVSIGVDQVEIRQFLDEALPLGSPKTAAEYIKRGDNHYDHDRYDLAMADYEAAIRLEPENSEAIADTGWVHYHHLNFDEALAAFEKALKINDQELLALWGRSMVRQDQKQYAEAAKDQTAAIKANPSQRQLPLIHHYRGNAYNSLEQYEEAIADFTRAIELNPQLAMAYRERAFSLAKQERYDEALRDLDRAAQLDATDPEVFNRIGNIAYDRDQYAFALTQYCIAAELNPREPMYFSNRGNTLRMMSRRGEAAQEFEHALKLAPDNDGVLNDYGVVLFESNRFREAAEVFAKAAAISPDVLYFRNQAHSLQELSEHAQAEAAFDRAIALAPQKAELYAQRGVSRQAIGKHSAAESDFQRAIELDPQTYQLRHTKRLVVTNETHETLQVHLQYFTRATTGAFRWYPGTPESGRFDTWSFDPGESAQLLDGDIRIHASRIRIWAEGAGLILHEAKDRDVILVPEGGYLSTSDGIEKFEFKFQLPLPFDAPP